MAQDIEPAPSPAELLALVDAEQARTTAAIEPGVRLVYGVWGLAWLVGFGALYVARAEVGPVDLGAAVAGITLALLLVTAMTVTGRALEDYTAALRELLTPPPAPR